MGGACSTYGEKRNALGSILVGKVEGKRPIGRHWNIRKGIRMDLKEIG
jgi:hypothetical protein